MYILSHPLVTTQRTAQRWPVVKIRIPLFEEYQLQISTSHFTFQERSFQKSLIQLDPRTEQ